MSGIFEKFAVDAAKEANAKVSEIDLVARFLAHLMETLHGDRYRVQIDHQVGFVAIVQIGRRRNGNRDIFHPSFRPATVAEKPGLPLRRHHMSILDKGS
ncbi:hypothetical protein [Mesorhizobium sp. B2-7-1]|uniref:hypothetical protein n=1 Tax=Mesorhizobium sp. B2-7-1 TaxID=2589909 RepID=UPI00112CAA85|nr:hypothetical protein [Mesorhizobium sp. B2-7-1]TPJ45655.1 hypothetical protein FJ471_32375 [Mesorhizobium sp. B2-7-1]